MITQKPPLILARCLVGLTWLLATAVLADDRATRLEPVTVRALPVEKISLPYTRSAPAEVGSLNRPRLSAEIAARIIAITVEPGDVAKAGAVLVELDCRDYTIQADVAEERARLAGIQLERLKKLSANQNVSQTQLDQQQTDTRIARKDFESARLRVERCKIRAPFTAAIGERMASVGEYVQPGSPILKVTDMDSVVLSARVAANDATSIGAATEFTFATTSGSYPVELEAVSPVVDAQDRSREARFGFVEKDATAAIGTIGRLSWTSARAALPSTYLVQRGSVLGVFLLDSGVARFTPLPRAQEGRPVEVELSANAQIITDGREKLKDGDPVTVIK